LYIQCKRKQTNSIGIRRENIAGSHASKHLCRWCKSSSRPRPWSSTVGLIEQSPSSCVCVGMNTDSTIECRKENRLIRVEVLDRTQTVTCCVCRHDSIL
jgi:hypothetical protein